ncbi:MAG: SDR family NAD(P)-dependent oxidoreductase [Wenzhouxiangellaceae bacterium]|nr:SDR family NAD(P)-dependent oxidoreductase [Wenzhouxiangellaceae bacterium]
MSHRLNSFPASSAALVQGASRGIGLGLVRALLDQNRFDRVIATCRNPAGSDELQALAGRRLELHALDVTRPEQVAALAEALQADGVELNLLLNVAGVLHGQSGGGDFDPEKKLEDIELAALEKVFAVNTFGPALVLRYFRPLLARDGKAVVAAVSARVGSIGDNRMGGWYAYRASKAALNQLLKTASIEFRRRNKNVIVAALHPGTTDTGLSEPFQANVPAEKLFSVDQTCGYLLDVIEQLETGQSGGFYAWDGQAIEW